MEDRERKRKSRFFPGVVVGFVLGGMTVLLAPGWLDALIPENLRPGNAIEGRVLDKSTESGRLLLKVETDQGVLLATFTDRQEEIDLLVEPNDRLALRLTRYEPFLENPRIERVRKERAPSPATSPSSAPPPMPPAEAPPETEVPPGEGREGAPPSEPPTTTAPPELASPAGVETLSS